MVCVHSSYVCSFGDMEGVYIDKALGADLCRYALRSLSKAKHQGLLQGGRRLWSCMASIAPCRSFTFRGVFCIDNGVLRFQAAAWRVQQVLLHRHSIWRVQETAGVSFVSMGWFKCAPPPPNTLAHVPSCHPQYKKLHCSRSSRAVRWPRLANVLETQEGDGAWLPWHWWVTLSMNLFSRCVVLLKTLYFRIWFRPPPHISWSSSPWFSRVSGWYQIQRWPLQWGVWGHPEHAAQSFIGRVSCLVKCM